MTESIVNFFVRLFQWIGRGIGIVVGVILWPFIAFFRWVGGRGILLKAIVSLIVVGLIAFYAYFFYVTQFWNSFNPDYPAQEVAQAAGAKTLAGDPEGTTQVAAQPATPAEPVQANTLGESSQAQETPAPSGTSCNRSAIVDVTARLVDFNVNQNAWISSMLASKLGFFGLDWKETPFFDNKASFQLGINQVVRRTTTELVDTLGRVRGTSSISAELQDARTSMAYPEDAWYLTTRGPTLNTTPSMYRAAIVKLNTFNDNLSKCAATFDARSDNLLEFLNRIAGDIGSTSDILRQRIDASDAGWFDPRADDRFWFAYGQLYAYYGILAAAKKDFGAVVIERNLGAAWDRALTQLRDSLDVQPWIISNGDESSSFFPSHLATMGFNLLRLRSQLVDINTILDR